MTVIMVHELLTALAYRPIGVVSHRLPRRPAARKPPFQAHDRVGAKGGREGRANADPARVRFEEVVGPEGLGIVSLFNSPSGQTVENPVPPSLALRAGVKPSEALDA